MFRFYKKNLHACQSCVYLIATNKLYDLTVVDLLIDQPHSIWNTKYIYYESYLSNCSIMDGPYKHWNVD